MTRSGFRVPKFVGLLAVAALLPGCASKPKAVWTPKPRVDWADIATEPVAAPVDQYRLLAPEPTKGLFPAAMAVSRVAVEPSPTTPESKRPRLYTDPRNEFLQWNTAFDDLMAVSEVFPIAERTLGGGEAEPQQIVAAFRALHAKLGLVYAVNELSEDHTEMIGVLYDLTTSRPLVSYAAQAESIPPPESASKSEKRSQDLWKTDSRALVRAEFGKLVHASLRELILTDRPTDLEDKSGWTPIYPTRAVVWPPRVSPVTP